MSVQVFNPTPQPTQASMLGESLGKALAQAVIQNTPPPQQMVQRGLLQEAFNSLDPNMPYEDQLKAIVPQLMTTQGGPEALQTLAPILQQRSKNRSISDVIRAEKELLKQEQRPSQPEGELTPREESARQVGTSQRGINPNEVRDKYRNPASPKSEEPIYPQMTAGPQAQPLMSPPQMKEFALNLMDESSKYGTPMSFQEATQIAQQEQQNREAYNQRLASEQESRLAHIKDMNADIVERAVNSGLIESGDDEARTVAERLGYEARNSDTPAERWEYVRTGLREFNTARQGLRREASMPGPFEKLGRKLIGNYKDKETVMKDLQPFVDKYKKYGLYDELRNELTSNLGMGPEDAELTIFPMTKEQNDYISKIPKSPMATKPPPLMGKRFTETQYPGSVFNIQEPERFDQFKNEIEGYLNKNKDANLVTLRGKLNQEKKYSWEDISRAYGELIEEGRFVPDNYQYSQLSIVNKAPLPGLTEQFKSWWTGTK